MIKNKQIEQFKQNEKFWKNMAYQLQKEINELQEKHKKEVDKYEIYILSIKNNKYNN